MVNSNLDVSKKKELKDYLHDIEQEEYRLKTMAKWKRVQN